MTPPSDPDAQLDALVATIHSTRATLETATVTLTAAEQVMAQAFTAYNTAFADFEMVHRPPVESAQRAVLTAANATNAAKDALDASEQAVIVFLASGALDVPEVP